VIDIITLKISSNCHRKQSLNSQTALSNSFGLRSYNYYYFPLLNTDLRNISLAVVGQPV